jgi:hypothetical protein
MVVARGQHYRAAATKGKRAGRATDLPYLSQSSAPSRGGSRVETRIIPSRVRNDVTCRKSAAKRDAIEKADFGRYCPFPVR